MLDAKLKKKWVKALRSGDYDQGETFLLRFKGDRAQYCCLGVLLELEHGEDAWDTMRPEESLYGSGSGYLYTDLGRKPNFSAEHQRHLAFLNDTGKSFEEIADYIEENL